MKFDKKTGMQILVVIILIAAAVFVFKRNLGDGKANKVVKPGQAKAADAGTTILGKLKKQAGGFLNTKKEPVPRQAVVKATQNSPLSGIVWDGKEPAAIMSGQVVRVGDKIQGRTVVAIEKNRVILNDGTRDIELTLGTP